MTGHLKSERGQKRRLRWAGRQEVHAFGRWLLAGASWLTRSFLGFTVGLAALAFAALGVFSEPGEGGGAQLLAVIGLFVLLFARIFDRVQRPERAQGQSGMWAHAELGTLFVAAAFVIIELTGGPRGLLYPLVYALVAFLVVFHSLGLSIYFLVLILGTEAATVVLQTGPADWRLFASHASFNLLFALLYALFLRTEIAQRRHEMSRAIDDHLKKISTEAEDFRLTSALSLESRELSPDEIRRRRRISSVQAIHDSLYNVLGVAERALSPHTVALWWMDADDRHLRLRELRSQSNAVVEAPLASGEGLLGAIAKRREPIILTALKPGHSGLVYYSRPQPVTDFAGVPVMDGQYLRGVLVVDRNNGQGFNESDIAVLLTLASEIVRAVQVERIFADMDREKYQKERFYQASREFNSALSVEQVAQVAIGAARRVSEAEFAAVAVAGETEGQLRIVAIDWPGHPEVTSLTGQCFAADEGLLGAAIKARHPLPHGTQRTASQCLFGPNCDVAVPAVKVFPLLWNDQGVGGLVLGSAREGFITFDLFEMVRVIADHAAIALANAQMFARVEKMATTDGLTGLVNHRQFQQLFDVTLARVERYGRKLSLILSDIDLFKTINDTYGHPVGDTVLKRIAAILSKNARRTDVVARYGGEEFAILMDETDRQGALYIAERIRQAVEAEVFRTDNGKFKCTLSLGIATFPDDANSKPRLAEYADQALYQAKRQGRNRTISYGVMRNPKTPADVDVRETSL